VRASRTGIALLVALGLAGCGSSGGDGDAGLTRAQRSILVAQLEATRGSVAARNVAGTKAAVDKFRGTVARLRRAGALSDATARALRVGAARLLERVRSDNARAAPATTTPQTQTTPAPAPPPPGQKKKHNEKKKHDDKGKGHKEKDG
jgi:hypothetical protein